MARRKHLNRARRHHYRPAFHLSHFVDGSGRVWVHDCTGHARPFQQLPRNIAYEDWLYAPDQGPDPMSDEVEVWLATQVEAPAAAPLARAAEMRKPDNSERSSLALFIAVQDMRTPKARDLIVGFYHAVAQEQWDMWVRNPQILAEQMAHNSGTRFEPDTVASLLRQFSYRITKGAWLDFIRAFVHQTAERLHQMTWSVAPAPNGTEFITSDLGIAKFSGSPLAPKPWAIGFEGNRDVWVFPLTPTAALVLAPDAPVSAQPLPAAWPGLVNRQLAQDARRFLYSRNRQPAVQAMMGAV